MSINNTLKEMRKTSGLTQEQVAEKLNVTRQALSSYESGRTEPDIDMLVRLAEIYQTDANSLIYGSGKSDHIEPTKKWAHILAALLVTLTTISSAFALCANICFPVKASAPDFEVIMQKHFALTKAWNVLGSLTLTISFVGFLLIFYALSRQHRHISFEIKAKYMIMLAACLSIPSALMSLADPVFVLVDYIITPINCIVHMLIFFVLNTAFEFIQKNRTD